MGEGAGLRVIRRLYTAALAVGLVVTAPSYVAKAIRRGTGLALRERLGRLPDSVVAAVRDRRAVWVHAVSVGEVSAAAPLLREIKIRYPSVCLFVTTVTATGRQTVIERVPQADAIAYFPLDFPRVVDRLLQTINPRLFLCVETELWPNFLSALARRGIPAFLVNGRLNARSARRYRWARRLFQPVLAGFYGFAVQTTADAQRLAGIGADPSRIVITGNLKFDQPADDLGAGGVTRRVGLGLAADELLWVAGSTRQGEEEPVLSAYRRLRNRGVRVVLLIAPRHPDRLDKIEAMVREYGFNPVRRSALRSDQPRAHEKEDLARVILLDTIGELAAFYHEAAVAFVGGTLVPVGGHNLLEPAARGKVVLFGPHTHKCEEIAAALLESGAGVRVESAEALAEHVGRLLADPTLRERMGRRGREMVARNQGAVERTLALLHPWLVE